MTSEKKQAKLLFNNGLFIFVDKVMLIVPHFHPKYASNLEVKVTNKSNVNMVVVEQLVQINIVAYRQSLLTII